MGERGCIYIYILIIFLKDVDKYIFKTAPQFPYVIQAELVLACTSLHNFLQKECRSDEFLVELENDSSPSYLDMEKKYIKLLSQIKKMIIFIDITHTDQYIYVLH